MAEFKDYSEKGSVLMQQALKKLADGDIDGFENDRREANRYFDLFYADINSESGKLTQLYGESRNFGIIYNVFEQNMENLYNTEEGKSIIKEAYKLIKNNNILNEQFKIYDLFENQKNIDDAKEFVNEAISLIKNHNRKQIMEANEKFIKLIKKYKLDEYVEIPEETENLYEAIEYLILNEKTFNNVNDIIQAQNVIVEHIENNKNTLNEQKQSVSFEEFEQKLNLKENEIEESLNEDEKKLLDLFTNNKQNNKIVFEKYKRETLQKINEALANSEENDKDGWQRIYEKINSKTYSNKLSENIINCAEMLEICSTIEE